MKVPRELRGVIEREYTPKMYHDAEFLAELDRRYGLAMSKHKRNEELTMTQKITLKAYTSDESSAFVSFTSDDQVIIESLDPKLPVEITLDGLGNENVIMFITHYGSDLVDTLIKVYGTYENVLDNVTLYITNGHTYHSTEELSEDYFEGLKVVL